jgi:hypothetical protein
MWAEMQVLRPEQVRGGQLRDGRNPICDGEKWIAFPAPQDGASHDALYTCRHEVAAGCVTEIRMVEGIMRAMTQLYAVSLAGASGYRWTRIGMIKPSRGRAIRNSKLAKALQSRTEFSDEEWEEFRGGFEDEIEDDGNVRDLRPSDFIQSGNSYFTPEPETIHQFEEVLIQQRNALPESGDLSLETDRTTVVDLQEKMIAAYVPVMIWNQCAGGAGAEINKRSRMVSDQNMPQLLAALGKLGLNAPRLKCREEEEAVVVRDSSRFMFVCDKCEIQCIE